MEKLFIIAKDDKPIKINNPETLPNNVGIVTTAQHLDKLDKVKNLLEEANKKVTIAGQVLGCNASVAKRIKDDVDCFLYIGDGRFHPIEVFLETQKPVYIIANNKIQEFNKEGLDKYEKQKKAATLKYLTSNNIGILVSTKEHQNKIKLAEELKEKLKQENKNAYLFTFDQLDFGQLENFPFIEVWVNTACPRMIDDYDKFNKPVIDIQQIPNYS